MLFRFSDIIPREHGAWAIFLVPFLTGALIREKPGLPTLLLLICIISLYLLRGCVELYFSKQYKEKERIQNFNSFYFYTFSISLMFIITTTLLIFYFQFWNLLFLGILAFFLFSLYYLFLFSKQNSRINQELIVLFGLTLTAPAAYYVTTGKWDKTILLLWILNIIFFQLGLLYVHNKIALHKKQKLIVNLWNKLLFSKILIGSWCISVITLYYIIYANLVRPVYFILLLPITIHIFAGTFLNKKKLNIRRMGYLQVGQGISFLIILIYLFRM